MKRRDDIRYIERSTGEIKREQIPGEGYLRFLYQNPLGKLPLHFLVKRKFFSVFYGKWMDSCTSRKKIAPFVETYHMNLHESLKNLKDFTSFNDFFHRKLKDGTRPIDKMENSVVSPADGKIMAFENIGKTKEIFVKGNQLTLEKLFQNPELSARFVDGTFVSIRLAPVDYHRFHFPYAGKIGKNHTINGYYRSVSPLAIRENFNIFLSNKREYALLETNGLGTIAMFEIGATMVGKISQTYQMGGFVQKGEEKGYFSFGGSTCILIFEKDKFILDADILENTKKNLETKVLMGEKIGIGASFS